jgi:hypothetical protein
MDLRFSIDDFQTYVNPTDIVGDVSHCISHQFLFLQKTHSNTATIWVNYSDLIVLPHWNHG